VVRLIAEAPQPARTRSLIEHARESLLAATS